MVALDPIVVFAVTGQMQDAPAAPVQAFENVGMGCVDARVSLVAQFGQAFGNVLRFVARAGR